MSNVLYFPNLKTLGVSPVSTGASVTAADASVHACLDVFPRNTAADALNVTFASTANLLARDIHDATAAPINGSAGAYIAFGTGITIPAGVREVQVSSNLGEPVEISFAANVGAATASTKKIFMVPGGAPGTLKFVPSTENKMFIRSLSTTAIASSYITANFMG